MKHLTTAVLITALSISGLGLSTTALAAGEGMPGGMHELHGREHHSNCWRASLSDEQAKKIDALRLGYMQKTTPLKTRIKQARIDLALLISTDEPEDRLIEKKIDEIVKLKAEKMRFKTDHQIAVRKLLTAEQRVNFDIKLLKKANREHKGYAHGGWHH